MPIGFHIGAIAEGGVIVAVGSTTDFDPRIATSTDGEAWDPVDLSALEMGRASILTVIAGSTGFVATGVRWNEDPGGVPDPFLLYSRDGRAWRLVSDPEPCSFQMNKGSWTDSGYTILGGRCRNEADFEPRPIRVLTSPDGLNWTTTTDFPEFSDPDRHPFPSVTDGQRIVALSGIHVLGADEWLWISDDGGATWATLTDAIPDNVVTGDATYGHGYFVMGAHRLLEVGPEPGSCRSPDGASWDCRFPGPVLANLAATATGYASLHSRPVGPLPGRDEVVQATSTDGLTWQETVLEQFGSMTILGTAATSRGLFVWGFRRDTLDAPLNYVLLLRRAPLP